jgi:hypothetical protein
MTEDRLADKAAPTTRRAGNSRLVLDAATGTIAPEVDAVLKGMIDGAHALIGTIDKQTYGEWKRHDWDAPDDCEFLVTFTAKELVLLDKIIDGYISAASKSRAALTVPLDARSAPAPSDQSNGGK